MVRVWAGGGKTPCGDEVASKLFPGGGVEQQIGISSEVVEEPLHEWDKGETRVEGLRRVDALHVGNPANV